MPEDATSHSIIKALKSPLDPPNPGGPSKISIAKEAWKSQTIYFPNKDEILAEWILNSLLKQKVNTEQGEALFSSSYWFLLSDILCAEKPTTGRLWLSTLLNRIPISGIVTRIFKDISEDTFINDTMLTDLSMKCLSMLWPISVARMTPDSQTDCFCSVLNFLAGLKSLQNTPLPVLEFLLLAIRSFRHSFGTASNKKRASTVIGNDNLAQWIKVATFPNEGTIRRVESSVLSEIMQTGIEVLFSAENLKSPHNPLIGVIERGCGVPMPLSLLPIIPRLYRAYVEQIRRHRFVIFGSNSNQAHEQSVQAKLRDAGLKAFAVCSRSLREHGDAVEVWRSICDLLTSLDDTKLVGSSTPELVEALQGIAPWAIQALEHSRFTDKNVKRADVAIQIFRNLLRIDFEFIDSSMRDIFSALLTINAERLPNSQSLLQDILDFHSKTRNILVYTSMLLDTLSEASLSAALTGPDTDVEAVHRAIILGPVLHVKHLNGLSRAVTMFLTSGQTQEVVENTIEALRKAYDGLSSSDVRMTIDLRDEQNYRKSKGGHKQASRMNSEAILAMRYSLLARLAAVLLPSLPFSTLSPPMSKTVKSKIRTFADGLLSTILKTPLEPNHWGNQIVLSSTMRIHHSLITSASLRDLCLCEVKTRTDIFDSGRRKNVLPELLLEAYQLFFDRGQLRARDGESSAVVDSLLQYLSENLLSSFSDRQSVLSWNGICGALDFLEEGGYSLSSIAVWHLLLDRWLPSFEELASPLQLKTFSEIILSLQSGHDTAPTYGLTAKAVLRRIMRSALFWELPSLRDALLSVMETVIPTGSLDDFTKLANEVRGKSRSKTLWEQRQIKAVLSVYEVLLCAPNDYLSKAQRALFVQRGVVADIAIYLTSTRASVDVARTYLWPRMVIRSWVGTNSGLGILNMFDDREFYLDYLLKANPLECVTQQFDDVSAPLLNDLFRNIIRQALQSENHQLDRLCNLLREPINRTNLLLFIAALTSGVPSEERKGLTGLETIENMHDWMEIEIQIDISQLNSSQVLPEQVHRVRGWRGFLALHKWLQRDTSPRLCGRTLVTKIGSEALLLVIDELKYVESTFRQGHLELLAASYISTFDLLNVNGLDVCDEELGHLIKNLHPHDFSALMDLVRDALSKGFSAPGQLRSAIHFSQVLVSNAPEGTSRVVQEFFEDCLHIFVDIKFSPETPDVAEEALRFIAIQCSERPASMRTLSIGAVWLMLARCLAGDQSHTPHTTNRILFSIVDVVGALIRLRRDLVQTTVPHLVAILRLLLSSLRSLRPQLGAKQTQLVADTLPWWIQASEPLAADEARAIARLLTSLQAKSVPRTFKDKGKGDVQRAESLAQPFSKHAPYVLLAYIEALNHPLCVLSLGVRRELEPGLFALCDIMSEHGRDAIMVSALDAGGKAALKGLWRDYEKQRYVGKG